MLNYHPQTVPSFQIDGSNTDAGGVGGAGGAGGAASSTDLL